MGNDLERGTHDDELRYEEDDSPTDDVSPDVDLEDARPLLEGQAECYREEVRPALAAEGIEIVDYEDLPRADRRDIRENFEESVLPTLTPLTFDPAHRSRCSGSSRVNSTSRPGGVRTRGPLEYREFNWRIPTSSVSYTRPRWPASIST